MVSYVNNSLLHCNINHLCGLEYVTFGNNKHTPAGTSGNVII